MVDSISYESGPGRKAVVVHPGARDSYQLARGLSDAGLLQALITDLFWPSDRAWAQTLFPALPHTLRELLLRRSSASLPSAEVRQCLTPGLRNLLLDRIPNAPFSLKQKSIRSADAILGREAGRLARETASGLITYSYVGYDAISAYGSEALLFQAHPHPQTMRRILQEEMQLRPECSESLLQEWELSLPEGDYRHLVEEPAMASRLLVASTFTKQSLIDNGTSADRIAVVPYGVDLDKFHPKSGSYDGRNPERLQLLFVGRITQRKGISYLLEALKLIDPVKVKLTVCGWAAEGLTLFEPFGDAIEFRPSVSAKDLVSAYQAADLFIFPSIAEGFGQVLLEALACGIPILTTSNTAAVDLIDEGVQGFIVESRRPDQLAERITWAIDNRELLAEMGVNARLRAEEFTWERFRMQTAKVAAAYLDDLDI